MNINLIAKILSGTALAGHRDIHGEILREYIDVTAELRARCARRMAKAKKRHARKMRSVMSEMTGAWVDFADEGVFGPPSEVLKTIQWLREAAEELKRDEAESIAYYDDY